MNKRNNTITSYYKAYKSVYTDNKHKHESVIAKAVLNENGRLKLTRQTGNKKETL